MIELLVHKFSLRNPQWGAGDAAPGQRRTLTVEAPYQTKEQWIEYRILDGQNVIDALATKPGSNSVEWVVPNLHTPRQVVLSARLREKPGAANGHLSVLQQVDSAPLNLKAFQVTMGAVDACFVPKQESLHAAFTIVDAGAASTAQRIEIWGERYPGAPGPLYTESGAIGVGANNWTTWDGKANHGTLKGKYITPEFGPYRLRVIIAATKEAAEDPFGKGLGTVAMAETSFDIIVNAVTFAVMDGFADAAKKDEYKLDQALAIEPRLADGTYAVTARLPHGPNVAAPNTPDEVARIRVPMARFSGTADDNSQAGINVGGGYMGGGESKWVQDRRIYTRPELPIELKPLLRSRDNVINNDLNQRGLFEPEAVGPLKIEPFAEDKYDAAMYAGGVKQSYWKKAAFSVKRGKHDIPEHTAANAASLSHWQARFDVTVANTRDFVVTNADPDFNYARGADELRVYLNYGKLIRSDRADDNELDAGSHDYREIDPGGGNPATTIRLRPDFTAVGDVLWIERADSTAAVPAGAPLERWRKFPPGTNCHAHYGGVRGEEPTADLHHHFRAKFSANPPKPREPIIGKHKSSFPYEKYVQLRPHPQVEVKKQQRVTITAMLDGKKKGLAGVIFSPSVVAGDSYLLNAWIYDEAYERGFGCVSARPRVKDRTGTLTVWRVMHVGESRRLPTVGTPGLSPGVGSLAELGLNAGVPGGYPAGTTPRLYKGDGINASFSSATGVNTFYAQSFSEWTIDDPPAGPTGDPLGVHMDVDLKKYRKTHNKLTQGLGLPGRVKLNANTDVKNHFAVWDHYRWQLPPGTPLPNLVSNTIATQPVGTPSATVANVVRGAIVAHGANPDVALNPGVAAIPVYANSEDDYENDIDGNWDQILFPALDKLQKVKVPARRQHVLRWPKLHETGAWIGYDALANTVSTSGGETNGFCDGGGKSLFKTWAVTETFPHEMGHAMNLAHFVAGNFEWKHHHVSSPDCLMSYAHSKAKLRQADAGGATVGPTGGGTTRELGWPDASGGAFAIKYPPLRNIPLPRSAPCAKCALKVRGWNDEVLPFAWNHPDLF